MSVTTAATPHRPSNFESKLGTAAPSDNRREEESMEGQRAYVPVWAPNPRPLRLTNSSATPAGWAGEQSMGDRERERCQHRDAVCEAKGEPACAPPASTSIRSACIFRRVGVWSCEWEQSEGKQLIRARDDSTQTWHTAQPNKTSPKTRVGAKKKLQAPSGGRGGWRCAAKGTTSNGGGGERGNLSRRAGKMSR